MKNYIQKKFIIGISIFTTRVSSCCSHSYLVLGERI